MSKRRIIRAVLFSVITGVNIVALRKGMDTVKAMEDKYRIPFDVENYERQYNC